MQSSTPTFYIYIYIYISIPASTNTTSHTYSHISLLSSTAVFSLVSLSLPLVLGERGGKSHSRQEANHTSVSPKYLPCEKMCLRREMERDRSFPWVSSKFPPSLLHILGSYLQGSSCHFLSPATYHRCVCDHVCMHARLRGNVLKGALVCACVTTCRTSS